MANFVKSVEYLEISLPSNSVVSVDLTKSQDSDNCVPFNTFNTLEAVLSAVDDRYPEVYFTTGTPDAITAKRTQVLGTVLVGAHIVEFDVTGDVSVQTGTFSMDNADKNITISSVGDVNKAFVLITFRHSSGANTWSTGAVSVVFNSTTQIAVKRHSTSGFALGRYYVIHTTGTDFSVIHSTIPMSSSDELKEVTIASVTPADTFLIGSHEIQMSSEDCDEGMLVVDLKNSTTIRARRAFNDFDDDTADRAVNFANTAEVQIISCTGDEFLVERGVVDWADSLTAVATITEIDQAEAIVISGGMFGHMSTSESSTADLTGNYAILDFSSNTQVTGTRADNTNPDGVTAFEVVAFALAGAFSTTNQAIAATAAAVAAFADIVSRFRTLAASTTATVVMNKVRAFCRNLVGTTLAIPVLAKALDLHLTLTAAATGDAVMPTPVKTGIATLTAAATGVVTNLVGPIFVRVLSATSTAIVVMSDLVFFFQTLAATASATAGLTRFNSFFRTLAASGTGVATSLQSHIHLLAVAATAVATAAIARLLVQGVDLVATATGVAADFTFKFCTARALVATAVGAPVLNKFLDLKRRLAVQSSAVAQFLADGELVGVFKAPAGWSQLVRNKVSKLFIIRR